MSGLALLLLATAPTIYTNEEDVYFAREAGREPPPWIGVAVGRNGASRVNAHGVPVPDDGGRFERATSQYRFPDGRTFALHAARPVTCWGAVPKTAKKADGSDDWYFVRDLKLHDQGGRVRFGGGDSGAPPVELKMRNVTWAGGPNRPSIVLYVFRADDLDRAASYSWADPGAKRIGINLRWMQASCTIDDIKGGTR